MFSAFMKDSSPFKTKFMVLVLISIFSIGVSLFFSQLYATKLSSNNHLRAEYTAQSEWLSKFDSKEATDLYKMVLKPAKRADLDAIQSDQLAILNDHNLTIVSVKNAAPLEKPDKKIPIKYQKSTVKVTGNWNDIMAALSEFELKHLVVITNASFALDDKSSGVSGQMKATLEYNIYFN